MRLLNAKFQAALPDLEPFKMIFADPPDNIGLGYGSCNDRLPSLAYEELLRSILWLSREKCDILWVSFNAAHLPLLGFLVHDFLKEGDWEFKPCVQVFTFGQHNKHDLGNNHRPLWRLMREGTELHPDAIRVPSWRQLHGDKRANPKGRVPGDVIHVEQYTRKTLPLPNLSLEDCQRIMDKIEVGSTDDCWEWQGGKNGRGYGQVRIGGRKGNVYYVTRLLWRLVHGTDPINQLICHTCDNPACCNPAHLFLGTDADNMADKVSKGRQARNKGVLHGCAKLTEEDVLKIYHASGTSASIAKDFGISDSHVRNIKTGKTWSHVTSEHSLSNVFNMPRITGNSKQRRRWHPTQLHEGLYERCVKLSCLPDDSICDLFAGTGTLARVCKATGNPCTLIEMDPDYCRQIALEHDLQHVWSDRYNEWRSK